MLHCKSKVVILPFLPRARMRSRGKAMPSCIFKNIEIASSRVAKSTINYQHTHTRTFLYLIQVQAVLYAVISATTYYRFPGSTPFEIARGSYESATQLVLHYDIIL